MSKILIKAIRPHRQKVLTQEGEEKRLQQWANQLAAEQLRGAGGDASGEQFTQARDALMRDAVMNPEKYGLKFMAERVPFEGQELTSDLTEADPEGEAAAIDSQFAPEEDDTFSGSGTKDDPFTTDNRDEDEEQTTLFDPRFTKKMFKAQKQIFHDAWSLLKSQ